ncbi:hypothetical protein PR048_027416 [Dryococelus australis]|uniref:DUF4371 domain-containing protein n=1 Tax=Dryococelus australis TaxID=614101 RepID=A0ABQ9GFR0_9NEOP|nr:hypothetical protein PR048_027416 [Dryococelus australis]
MTILVRFVHVTCSDGAYGVKICKHFLGFVPVADAANSPPTNKVLEFLEKMIITLSYMRGQGYNNGANMKGMHSGVQKIILDMNKRAFYMPCSSHSLNPVLNDAAMSSQYAVTLFYIVKKLMFLPLQLGNHVLSLTLKSLSNTRWESRIEALISLRYQIGKVYNAVVINILENFDCITAHEAKSLANLIKDYTFLSYLVIWYDVLLHINVVNKSLQSITTDVSNAICMIRKTKEYFEKNRTEDKFKSYLIDSKELA